MYKLLPLNISLALILSVTAADAMTINKATSISAATAAQYLDQELSNTQPLKVLKNLLTTKVNDADNPLRIKAVFDGISGRSGSAIFHYGYLDLLSGSVFSNNTASGDGGAVYINDTQGLVNFYKTRFENNSSTRGGAVFALETPLTFYGGTGFYNNSATDFGGAIHVINGKLNFNTDAGDIIFSGNNAGGKPNDIYMTDNSVLNINGSHALVLDGGINNIGENNRFNTIINNNAILDINTAKVYADTVNFSQNSALYVKIKDANTYGQIFANKINIAPNGEIKITVGFAASNKNDSFVAEILNAEDELNGEFSILPDIAENELYDITYLDNGRYLIDRKPDNENDDGSKEEKPASSGNKPLKPGEAWLENGDFMPGSSAASTAEYLYELKQTAPLAYEDALKALSPASATAVQNTVSQINKQIMAAVSSQLSGGSSGLSAGKSAGDNLFHRSRSWVKLLTNHAKLSGQDGFSSSASGISMGVDKLVSSNLRIGLGYAYSNGTVDSFRRNTDLNGHTAIIYGEYKPSFWFINSIATYNHSRYRENKNLSGLIIKSDYDVDNIGLQIMSGIETGIFTPQAGLRYTYFHRPDYQDTAGQQVEGDNSQTLTAVLGSKIAQDYIINSKMTLRPELKLAVTYDLLNENDNTLVSLPNGAAYETRSRHLNRIGFETGASVHFNILETTDIALGYEGRFRKDYQDHSGLVDIKYHF